MLWANACCSGQWMVGGSNVPVPVLLRRVFWGTRTHIHAVWATRQLADDIAREILMGEPFPESVRQPEAQQHSCDEGLSAGYQRRAVEGD
jgi:hypothetical protein